VLELKDNKVIIDLSDEGFDGEMAKYVLGCLIRFLRLYVSRVRSPETEQYKILRKRLEDVLQTRTEESDGQ